MELLKWKLTLTFRHSLIWSTRILHSHVTIQLFCIHIYCEKKQIFDIHFCDWRIKTCTVDVSYMSFSKLKYSQISSNFLVKTENPENCTLKSSWIWNSSTSFHILISYFLIVVSNGSWQHYFALLDVFCLFVCFSWCKHSVWTLSYL